MERPLSLWTLKKENLFRQAEDARYEPRRTNPANEEQRRPPDHYHGK